MGTTYSYYTVFVNLSTLQEDRGTTKQNVGGHNTAQNKNPMQLLGVKNSTTYHVLECTS